MTQSVDPEGRAARFIALEVHESTHDRLVWGMRQNRDKAVAGVPEWEKLRELASQIKEHTLTHLDHYLEQFEANATKLGTHVHWARDADEHNAVVYDILNAHRVKSLIKSKSMLQEECGMTPYLQKRGIEVTESDLGERIQQLSDEPPSHIVVPAIHKLRTDVAALFAEKIGTDPKDSDPHDLAEAMRQNARPRFLKADAGMTGANFAVAETGGFVVCTNEGNADIGASVPPLHVASIGIEKLIPRARDLGVFIRMLSRSPGLADHAVHLALPRPAAGRGAARGARGQHAERPARLAGLLARPQVHPLRGVHEHLPGLPPRRRLELRGDLLRPDRRDPRPRLRPVEVSRAALPLVAVRVVYRGVPGQDRHLRPDLQMAPRGRREGAAAAHQEGRHECAGDDPGPPGGSSTPPSPSGSRPWSTCRGSCSTTRSTRGASTASCRPSPSRRSASGTSRTGGSHERAGRDPGGGPKEPAPTRRAAARDSRVRAEGGQAWAGLQGALHPATRGPGSPGRERAHSPLLPAAVGGDGGNVVRGGRRRGRAGEGGGAVPGRQGGLLGRDAKYRARGGSRMSATPTS